MASVTRATNTIPSGLGVSDGFEVRGNISAARAVSANLEIASGFNPVPEVSAAVSYFQRVWDAGSSVWCYYTTTTPNPTPAAVDTTPNYTGAISAHSIVSISS